MSIEAALTLWFWTPSHDFTLPAPPENTWSSSRKCWRKTGSDDSLRSRNRGWGCSAASSPRWGSTHSAWHSSVFHDADPTASCADARLVCAQTGEKSRDDALEAIKGNLDGFSRDAKMHPTPSSQTKKAGRFTSELWCRRDSCHFCFLLQQHIYTVWMLWNIPTSSSSHLTSHTLSVESLVVCFASYSFFLIII